MAAATTTYTDFAHFAVTLPASAALPHVAHVEINRPSKLNAFDGDVWREFGRLFPRLSADPEVRAIVLSGRGDRAFTSGLDLQFAANSFIVKGIDGVEDPARKAAGIRRHVTEFQEWISTMEQCEKPVICVMHGLCYGLAIDIACCADVRICARDARMSVREVDIGLAADIGTLSRLPRAVGSMSWAKDVCLSAREFGADEALAAGFVSRVSETKADALRAALDLAGQLAAKSPVAVQGTKEILNHARDHSVQDNLRYTVVWNSAALQTQDIQRALMSMTKKKKPTFEKL